MLSDSDSGDEANHSLIRSNPLYKEFTRCGYRYQCNHCPTTICVSKLRRHQKYRILTFSASFQSRATNLKRHLESKHADVFKSFLDSSKRPSVITPKQDRPKKKKTEQQSTLPQQSLVKEEPEIFFHNECQDESNFSNLPEQSDEEENEATDELKKENIRLQNEYLRLKIKKIKLEIAKMSQTQPFVSESDK